LAKAIYDNHYRELIELMIACRKASGISQSDLSSAIGIPQYDISKIENFVREVSIIEIDKWLSALNIESNIISEMKDKLKQQIDRIIST
jgi:transcriptional regulator with XRE-family HTH domain